MLEKLYKKSEVWFAVVFIIAYVIGDSFLMQASDNAGIEMIYEEIIGKVQIPVSVVLCVVSAASAVLIFRNANREQ